MPSSTARGLRPLGLGADRAAWAAKELHGCLEEPRLQHRVASPPAPKTAVTGAACAAPFGTLVAATGGFERSHLSWHISGVSLGVGQPPTTRYPEQESLGGRQ